LRRIYAADEAQGERRAEGDRPFGVLAQLRRERTRVDDRVTPVVQPDAPLVTTTTV
jgi:hypothetical protein